MCLDCLLLGWDTILNAILDQTYPTMGDGEKIVALTFRYEFGCMRGVSER